MDLLDVSHEFDSVRDVRVAVRGVSLRIDPGEFVVIVGPSGCGKSTLLNIVAGFQEPSSGVALVDGIRVVGPGADRGMVFQQPRLFPWMSVRKNIEFGPLMAGRRPDERRRMSDDSLALVGLTDVADRAPYELSGGMQQRAAIARALANHPRVLLMDEPFSALDALTRERLQDELLAIWRRTGVTVVFVTHSVDEAVYLATRVIVMRAHPGEVILERRTPWTADGDLDNRRADPRFAALREEVTHVLRTSAFE